MADRLEEIRKAGAKIAMHLNFGDGYAYVYTCIGEPRISISTGGPKKGRKSKRKYYRLFQVVGVDSEFTTLEEAVLAVQKLDQAKAIDAEWEAAAPPKRSKPAAIEGYGDG